MSLLLPGFIFLRILLVLSLDTQSPLEVTSLHLLAKEEVEVDGKVEVEEEVKVEEEVDVEGEEEVEGEVKE